jgi:hypothetical protein
MDAFKVDLFSLKNEGGSASATIDVGRRRPFLAWGSVSMVDPLTDFDRDNAYAFDIFIVDGNLTSSRVTGGEHWGPQGSGSNVFDGAGRGFGAVSTSGYGPFTRQISIPSGWACS